MSTSSFSGFPQRKFQGRPEGPPPVLPVSRVLMYTANNLRLRSTSRDGVHHKLCVYNMAVPARQP